VNNISPTPWIVRCMSEYIEVTDATGNSVTNNESYYPTALKVGNASIISAAPDLLEALEFARNGLLWYQEKYPFEVSECDFEFMKQIDSVINKATKEIK
jgi:hypothetical protein